MFHALVFISQLERSSGDRRWGGKAGGGLWVYHRVRTLPPWRLDTVQQTT